ncbi:MAG: sulfurtransferase [Verrucomicrobia bacterium]|nr:sulfurtransferase [Verrucomicrobiota bacterium]
MKSGKNWNRKSGASRLLSWLPALMAGGLALTMGMFAGCKNLDRTTTADFPAREAPNYHGLVSVYWLKAVLDYRGSEFQTPRPATYRHQPLVILEASWATLEKAGAFHDGHIPGAVHFNTDDLENGAPRWRLREANEVQRDFGRAGISRDTTVIVYGEKLIAAARVWWALKYAGVDDVRLLDGGFPAWTKAGFPVDKQVHQPQGVQLTAPVASNLLATTEYVRQQLPGSRIWLADARSLAEFTGRTSGYSYLEAKGRIPSSRHIGDGDDGAYLYKQRNGHLRPPREILAHWRQQGLVPAGNGKEFDREVVFYCGGGWRSSVAFFYAWLLGFENVRNYSDGWSGWSTEYFADPEAHHGKLDWKQRPTQNPVEVGPP